MTERARARESRREAARRQDQNPVARWLLPIVGIVILGTAAAAFLASQAGPGASASPSAAAVQPPVINGNSLPVYSPTGDDPAKGLVAPVVAGHNDQGLPVTIEPTGKPMLVVFAAHWCTHCQNELPILQAWLDSGGAPSDVEFRSVSTAIDPTAPNYPPAAWLERIGWTVPVIVDPTGSVANAYGLNAFPFLVVLDGDGKVVARMAGEIGTDALDALLAAVPRN